MITIGLENKTIRNLSKPEIKRIMKRLGANRVSKEAKEKFLSLLNNLAYQISYDAVQLSKESGRKTIKPSDIALSAVGFVSSELVTDDFDFDEGELESEGE